MFSSLGSTNTQINFKKNYSKDTLLPNNIHSKIEMDTNNLVNSFVTYPIKGLKGSKNSNFHEFLSMGIVPYLVGSASLIGISMASNKFLTNSDLKHANKYTKTVALGVLFYGLFKKLSDGIINTAVKLGTGIDPQTPYAKINYQLKENPGEQDSVSLEYHKVGESVDYPYWSLLYGEGENLNKTFDDIGKKNGFGENLNDSDQEIKPAYKEVLSKSTFTKNIVSYLWAVAGVALAAQKDWLNFDFGRFLPKFKNLKADFKNMGFGNAISKNANDLVELAKDFGNVSIESCKSLWKGKYGKPAVLIPSIASVLGIANTLHINNKPVTNNHVINRNQESVEC